MQFNKFEKKNNNNKINLKSVKIFADVNQKLKLKLKTTKDIFQFFSVFIFWKISNYSN